MRKLFIVMLLLVAVSCHAQDSLPRKAKPDSPIGASVQYSGRTYSYSGKRYIDVYEVLTDSIVYRFGLEFRAADSSFVRKVSMDGTVRKLYDQMKANAEYVEKNQERMRKETIEHINRYRTSPEVWFYFKLYGILDE